jgi:hypothetical protein
VWRVLRRLLDQHGVFEVLLSLSNCALIGTCVKQRKGVGLMGSAGEPWLTRLFGLCTVVVLVFPVTLAHAGSSADSAQVGAFCVRPVIVSRLPRGAVLDTNWYVFGRAVAGCRIVNRRNVWAVEDTWFFVDGHAERAYRREALDSLLASGVLTDSTQLLPVSYRFMVKAATARAARTAANARLQAHPSKQVLKELRRIQELLRQKSLKDTSP